MRNQDSADQHSPCLALLSGRAVAQRCVSGGRRSS